MPELTPQAKVEAEGHYYDDGDTPREIADRLSLDAADVVAFLQRDTAIAIEADLPDVSFEAGADDAEDGDDFQAGLESDELDWGETFGPGGPREAKSWRPYVPESG